MSYNRLCIKKEIQGYFLPWLYFNGERGAGKREREGPFSLYLENKAIATPHI